MQNAFLSFLPEVRDLRGLYQMATLETQHELIKAVFKGKLTYSDGVFGTPVVAPMFEENALAINNKGLLVYEQPSKIYDGIPSCSGTGNQPTSRPSDKSRGRKVKLIFLNEALPRGIKRRV